METAGIEAAGTDHRPLDGPGPDAAGKAHEPGLDARWRALDGAKRMRHPCPWDVKRAPGAPPLVWQGDGKTPAAPGHDARASTQIPRRPVRLTPS